MIQKNVNNNLQGLAKCDAMNKYIMKLTCPTKIFELTFATVSKNVSLVIVWYAFAANGIAIHNKYLQLIKKNNFPQQMRGTYDEADADMGPVKLTQ
jgi:hypothetical protein